jgi:hypothetical protein
MTRRDNDRARGRLYPQSLGTRYGWLLILLSCLAMAVVGAVALHAAGVR